ncbi:uncharacterized protein LOC113496112 [Trichoplusia ni]|uniref:Uncharacterized protein LOC113496112 n=1 Tax=Trichoplusia ni TaxID=7111 RepID=A0A7E5VRR9_TRINI|nr:uncharacterized protein LOC113496112 [Trichoplusia ni]
MKMVSKILVFAFIVCTASAARWVAKLPPIPPEFAGKQGCYIKEINTVVPFGARVTPLRLCYEITCDQHEIQYASCGVVATDDPLCHMTEVDLSKPYPACCPDVWCELDNKLN